MQKKQGVNPKQYVVMHGWMRNIPQINNISELVVYALIYGFSQEEENYFAYRQDYIARWLGMERVSCNRIMQKLEKLGLIEKSLLKKNGAVSQYKYRAIVPNGTQENDESQNVTRSELQNVTRELQNVTRSELQNVTRSELQNVTRNNNNIYNTISTYKSAPNKFNDFMKNEYNFSQLEFELLNQPIVSEKEK